MSYIKQGILPQPITPPLVTLDLQAQALAATYFPAAQMLSVFGDGANNTIDISRNAAGAILVNNGSVPIAGGTPTVANTALIEAYGQGGNDVITVNETNGALPRANLFGGAGNDTLTGGSGNDQLFGQSGNDVLLGKGGNDSLFGGADNDVLTGGDGNDMLFGESGDDRFVWNPGDDTDLNEGGAGIDTSEVNGGNGAEVFTTTANGARVRFDRLDPAPFAIDIGTTENLVVNMGGGNDQFSATGNLAALIKITVNGGAGNDTILGSNGADALFGGGDDDFVDGQQGADTAFLGAGDDTFQWDPGDGSDVVEGEDGDDTLLFNGSAGNEIIDLSANADRLRLTRNLGNIVMDVDGVENVRVNASGGTDTVVINDLGATDVTSVYVDLAPFGGTTGDAAADVVVANATGGDDTINALGLGAEIAIFSLPATLLVNQAEAIDTIVINGLGGDDNMAAASASGPKFVLDGGDGNDTMFGSGGGDTLLGGNDDDVVDGNGGNDVALLGDGDDRFQWNPGDGNDVVEGQDGYDTLTFNAASVAENVDIVANAGRVLLVRNVANVMMDVNGVERIDVLARGGADNIVVGDLTGTHVQRAQLELGLSPGDTGDGAVDQVTVNGTNVRDVIVADDATGEIVVTGIAAAVHIAGAEADGSDRLVLNALGGDDFIDASALDATAATVTLNGGLGSDVLIGGAGNDGFNGGDGNDTAIMGAGDDSFVWNPGDDNDTLEGEDGFDALVMNGSAAGERFTVSANGDQVRLLRDIANITMDADGVERFEINALGGVDNIEINDVAGTDLAEVTVALAAFGGGGDAQADTVTVNAGNDADVALVLGDAAGVHVLGLAAQVSVTGAEAANDTLTVNGGDGDDVLSASGLQAGAIRLVLNGGEGDDVIIGSDGDDVLIGGPGDDVILGGLGNDVIDGGEGDDIEIQGFAAGALSDDAIDLRGRGFTFDWLMANASDVDGSAVLDLGDQTILLRGVSTSALHQDDFLLS